MIKFNVIATFERMEQAIYYIKLEDSVASEANTLLHALISLIIPERNELRKLSLCQILDEGQEVLPWVKDHPEQCKYYFA